MAIRLCVDAMSSLALNFLINILLNLMQLGCVATITNL